MKERASESASGAVKLVAGACALFVLVMTARRLLLGVDFGDEATYVALAWRFVLGDRPFVDEVNLIQTASFFTLPLVWLWKQLMGDLDGVVLFLRCAWLAASAVLAAWSARKLAPGIGSGLAWLVVLPIVAGVPLGIPTFSYNTLASGFFLVGLVLLLVAVRGGARRSWFAAGVAHGWAALAIPTYLLAALAGLVCALALVRERRRAAFLCYAAGGVLAVALFTPLLAGIDRETFAFGYAYTGGSGAWIAKLDTLRWQTWRLLELRPWVGVGIAAFLLLAWLGHRRLALVALAAASALLVPGRGVIDSSVHLFLTALLGAFVFPFVRKDPHARSVFVVVWIPGVIGAVVAAWTSGNAIANAGFGALPAAIATSWFAARFALEEADGRKAELAAALVPAVFALLLVHEQRAVYLDDEPERLVARIEDGPFAGLRTTPEKKAWLDDVSSAIRAAAPGHERIVAVVHFPLAYLLTDLRPATRTVWGLTCPPEQDWDCDERFTADLAHFDARDVLVVELRRLHYSSTEIREQPAGSVSRVVRELFQPTLERGDYSLFVPR